MGSNITISIRNCQHPSHYCIFQPRLVIPLYHRDKNNILSCSFQDIFFGFPKVSLIFQPEYKISIENIAKLSCYFLIWPILRDHTTIWNVLICKKKDIAQLSTGYQQIWNTIWQNYFLSITPLMAHCDSLY